MVRPVGGTKTATIASGATRHVDSSDRSPGGLLSNQGEKSINFYFIRVPLRKKY